MKVDWLSKPLGIAASILPSLLLVFTLSVPAQAAPSTAAEARQSLESLGRELQTLQDLLSTSADDLEATKHEIEQTELEIERTEGELQDARTVLAGRTRSSYKTGGLNIFDIILESTSFEDFISRIYYADKVAEADAQAINTVQSIQSDLESHQTDLKNTQASQEETLNSVESQVAAYEQKVADAQAIYNALDAEEQAKLAEEAAQATETNSNGTLTNAIASAVTASQSANEREQAREESASQSAPSTESGSQSSGSSQGSSQSTPSAPSQGSGNSGSASSGSQSAPSQGSSGSSSSGGSSSSSSGSSSSGSSSSGSSSSGSSSSGGNYDMSSGDPVQMAMQFVGKVPYVYGGTTPAGFDCSGLVNYVFGKLGKSLPRTTYGLIDYLKAKGSWKTSLSELNYGDLVFTHEGHVGIYAGNGMMVDAPKPGDMVSYRKVYTYPSCYGGGSVW